MSEEIKDPEAVLAALERAKNDAKANREALEAAQSELAKIKQDWETARGEIKNNLVTNALKEKGLNHERVSKFIDMDGVTFEGGQLKGLDESLTKLETDLPELFDTSRNARGRLEMEPKGEVSSVTSTSEAQANRLFGNKR